MLFISNLIIPTLIGLSSFALASQTCPDGTYAVRSHNRRAYYRMDGTLVRATVVSASCRAKSRAYEAWSARLVEGLPPNWPNKTEKIARWSEEERERVIEALSELPEILWGPGDIKFFRSHRSADFPNPSSQMARTIVLYDNAFDLDRRLSRIIAHELAHVQYEVLNGKGSLDYRRATDWKLEAKGFDFFWAGRPKGYIEEDGRTSPKEDFANNIEGYLFEPVKLKQMTPKAYDWIKNHFGASLNVRGK